MKQEDDQRKWEELCQRLNVEPTRHRTTGKILLYEGMPISKGLLEIFAENDARRNGTTYGEELEKLYSAWEAHQEQHSGD